MHAYCPCFQLVFNKKFRPEIISILSSNISVYMGKQIMIYAESKFFDWSEVAICDTVDNLDINIVYL